MTKYKNTKVGFTSDITDFLTQFDKKPEAHSKARKAEELKYKRVHALRDTPDATVAQDKIWKGF